MRKLALFCFIICFMAISSASRAQVADVCELYGAVFIADKPQEAHFLVYLEENETFADLVVFEEENVLFADRKGIWAFTKNRGFSDFSIFIEKDKDKAHFSIFYTDVEAFAGCQ